MPVTYIILNVLVATLKSLKSDRSKSEINSDTILFTSILTFIISFFQHILD